MGRGGTRVTTVGARRNALCTLYDLYSNMEYGSPFTKPPIKEAVIPGGWVPLHNRSPFILSATEFALEYLVKNLNYTIPADIKLKLFTAGAQIVSGINIYLEFRIEGFVLFDVQILVNQPVKVNHESGSPELTVDKIYVTNRRYL